MSSKNATADFLVLTGTLDKSALMNKNTSEGRSESGGN